MLDNKIKDTQVSALTIGDRQNADINNKNVNINIEQLPKDVYLYF